MGKWTMGYSHSFMLLFPTSYSLSCVFSFDLLLWGAFSNSNAERLGWGKMLKTNLALRRMADHR